MMHCVMYLCFLVTVLFVTIPITSRHAGVGVQPDVTKQLMSEVNIDSLEDWQKYVVLVFDEVKIKEGIVYNKHDCIES